MRSASMVVASFMFVFAGTLATPALAQWATDPSVNTPVATGSGDQGVPLVRPTADGGAWVSFFDNGPGNGYKPAIQRLSATGERMLPGNGVILANRTNTATFVYDCKVDAAGNAIVAFDDNSSGSTVVTVQKVAPDGTLVWGSAGVQVPNTASVLAPRVAPLSDGSYVVAWAASNILNFQRITADGQFPDGGTWSVAETGRYQAISDLQAGAAGEVIALWIRGETSSAQASRKGLKIQKWNASNLPQWSGSGGEGTPIDIYVSSQTPLKSIQNGYFPTMIPDGTGGAVVAFYDNGATRNAWLQHVTAAGVLRFEAGGIAVSTTPSSTELRLSASAAYDAANDEYTVAYQRSNTNQSQFGLSAQRISPSTGLLWTGSGVEVVALGGFQSSFINTHAAATGSSYLVWQQSTGAVTHEIQAASLDASGSLAWSPAILPVSTRSTAKGRLSVARSVGRDQLIGAWSDGSSGEADLLAQNINLDGTIGPSAETCPADFNGDDFVDFFDYSDYVEAFETGGPGSDFNGDGFTDFFDYSDFVEAFETGC